MPATCDFCAKTSEMYYNYINKGSHILILFICVQRLLRCNIHVCMYVFLMECYFRVCYGFELVCPLPGKLNASLSCCVFVGGGTAGRCGLSATSNPY